MKEIPISNDPIDENNKNQQHQRPMPINSANTNSDAVWNSLFGLIISIIGGAYIGLSSRSMRESWIYCFILFGLSIFCFLMTITSRLYSRRKAVSSFIIYFLIAGLTSPIASYLGIQLV